MTAWLTAGLTAGAVLVLALLTALLWRRRARPAATPLLAFAALLLAFLLAHAALYVETPIRDVIRTATGLDPGFGYPFNLQRLAISASGGLWFLFALRYTGRGERLTGPFLALLGAVWGALVTVAGVGWGLGIELRGRPIVEPVLNLGLYVIGALFIVGIFLVAETVWRRNAVGRGEAGLLAAGASCSTFVTLASRQFTHPATPVLVVGVAGVLLLAAVHRHPVFEALPVARVAGRDRLIEEVEDAILVVDRRERVRDLNAAAESAFGISRPTAQGSTLASVLPEPFAVDQLAGSAGPVRTHTDDGTVLAITADPIVDERDRRFGHVVRAADVTPRHRRERRLSVLHQLLSGALRERLQRVADDVTPLAGGAADPGPSDGLQREPGASPGGRPGSHSASGGQSETAHERQPEVVGAAVESTVRPLKRLVRLTRDLEQALGEPTPAATDVGRLVRRTLGDSGAEPAAGTAETLTMDTPNAAVTAIVDPSVLEPVLELLVTEATASETGPLAVTVGDDRTAPEIRLLASETVGSESGGEDWPGDAVLEITRLGLRSIDGRVTTVETADDVAVVLQLPPTRETVGMSAPAARCERAQATGLDHGIAPDRVDSPDEERSPDGLDESTGGDHE